MDDALGGRLFDPRAASDLVLARRPPTRSAVAHVVSDVVWHEVVVLLRWAAADTHGSPELEAGRWWRLATGCADLLRRLPALSDELAEPWQPVGQVGPAPRTGAAGVEQACRRLVRLLRSPAAPSLSDLVAEIDALGEAAVTALASTSLRTVPGAP